MAQIGCSDIICLTLNSEVFLPGGPTNSYFFETVSNDPLNFWELPIPVVGSANPFAVSSEILMGVSSAGMTTTTSQLPTSYEIFYFQAGSFISVPFTTPILIPGTYVIRVTSAEELDNEEQPCIYDFSFAINNSYNFVPLFMNGSTGNNVWCDAWGCTDSSAQNWNNSATANDGSCVYDMSGDPYGCTDINACNYNFLKTIDDGSCDYSCRGCMDGNATNYNPTATIPCNGLHNFCENMGEPNCCCDLNNQTYGCLDPFATNYDSTASFDDGSCEYINQGCTDSRADNYDPTVTIDDGSCEIGGCMNPSASNWNMEATFDNGSCIEDNCKYGCTDPTSSNYDPTATCDDNSCMGGCCGETTEGNFIITGFTESKLSRILWVGSRTGSDSVTGQFQNNVEVAMTDPDMTAQYGVNEHYPLVRRVPSLGIHNGWTQIKPGVFTAYTVDNINYWSYARGGTRFAAKMKNCCPGCLYPDIKEEWTMGHVFPPQIENNVFIDRGVASVFEEHYRITEVRNLEEFDRYQSGYFNIIT